MRAARRRFARAGCRAVACGAVAGAILFNGNAETDAHLVRAAASLLLSSRHRDPEVASSRRVALVTAAWSDREHDEGHVKRAINEIGLPSRHEGGFDTTLVNLSLLQEL